MGTVPRGFGIQLPEVSLSSPRYRPASQTRPSLRESAESVPGRGPLEKKIIICSVRSTRRLLLRCGAARTQGLYLVMRRQVLNSYENNLDRCPALKNNCNNLIVFEKNVIS